MIVKQWTDMEKGNWKYPVREYEQPVREQPDYESDSWFYDGTSTVKG